MNSFTSPSICVPKWAILEQIYYIITSLGSKKISCKILLHGTDQIYAALERHVLQCESGSGEAKMGAHLHPPHPKIGREAPSATAK